MAEATDLVHAFLLIEGHYNQGWETRAQLDGILMAAQLEHGVGVMWTQTVAETADTLRRMETWLTKGTHGSLMGRRASPKHDDNGRSWREHVWMTIDGISVAWARKLDDYFDGRLPIQWTCEWDKVSIKGFGPVKRKTVEGAWGGTDGT